MLSENRADKLSGKIIKHYESHGVSICITGFEILEEKYIYSIKLLRGASAEKFFKCAKDIQLALMLPIFEPVKNNLSIDLIVSEQPLRGHSLLRILQNPIFYESKKRVPIVFGYDPFGTMVVEDLVKLIHLLIGGSSGSGKSTLLRNLILSIVVKQSVNSVNLLLFDIGASDLSLFNGVAHLTHPVIKDAETGFKVVLALKDEMERRIAIENSNTFQRLPYIVCVVDEFLSFISDIPNKKDSQKLLEILSSLLRRGRHAKIIMILAAQDPTLKNMKCDISNITTRIAFACAKPQNSVAILGVGGADKLSGKGTMLLKSREHINLKKIQGAYISSKEIKDILGRINFNSDDRHKFEISVVSTSQIQSDFRDKSTNTLLNSNLDNIDEILAKIIIWSLSRSTISCKQVEDRFHIGYKRANSLLEKMHSFKIIGDLYARLPRTILPSSYEDLSTETISLLKRNGYLEDDIAEIFKAKNQGEDNPIAVTSIVPIETYDPNQEIETSDNIISKDSSISKEDNVKLSKKIYVKNIFNPPNNYKKFQPRKHIKQR